MLGVVSACLQSIGHYAVAVLLSCLLGVAPALALEQMTLQLASLDGNGWQAQQLQLQVNLGKSVVTAHLTVKQAQLTGVAEPVRDVVIDCPNVELLQQRFACPRARISGRFPYLGRQQLNANASYGRRDGALVIQLQNLKLANGQAAFTATMQGELWQALATIKQADITELLKLAQRFAPAVGKELTAAGQWNASLAAQGRSTQLTKLQWQVQGSKLSVSNHAGTLASDALAFNSMGEANNAKGDWQFDARVQANTGQAYAEPVFVNIGDHPLTMHAQGAYLSSGALQLNHMQFEQQDVMSATARGHIAFEAKNLVPELQLQIDRLQLPGFFATYLQPFLIDTGFKNLRTRGSAQGAVLIKNTRPLQVDLTLADLSTDDGNKSLVFNGVNGELHWRDEAADGSNNATSTAPTSRLGWQSGTLLGLELGATQLQLELWGTNARVAEPARIPIFNGALAVDAFRVRKAGTAQMAFMLDAHIEPINVAQLCKAFGWPAFGGELSGAITKLRLEQDTLTLGATLNAKIFAGDVAISNMRLEGALSQWPRFNADIKLDNLDLEQLTQAFSFGRVTGRLSGEINKLSLFNWEPVSFDARLYTPADDRSKHRISQRAVQNIGSIGGGSGGSVAAALQSGVLRFFDDFNYDRLGISCRLQNEVCFMNGVAPADNGGYYLVKGRGLPRIDVIGNSTRVDWPRLVAQLKAATEAGTPVVR